MILYLYDIILLFVIFLGLQQQVEEFEFEEEDNFIEFVINDIKSEKNERRGIEIKLRNLIFKDNVLILICIIFKVIIQCGRCKNKMDVIIFLGRLNMVICLKCSYFQILIFRFVIMYQFFFVVGYLDLDGCVSFDFIFQDCVFKLGCFSCNKEMKVKVCILVNKR